MKINQLFKSRVETETLIKLLRCFGLTDLRDKKTFCKYDLIQQNTVQQINHMQPELDAHYLPCKAKIYLHHMNEKRAITILKQILRLHGYFLSSKEKNLNNKKIIFYQLMNEKDKIKLPNMKHFAITNILKFD